MAAASRTFGKYDIVEQLGRGGFATVYRARDRTLDRDVALKILHPHYAQEPEFAQRFLHEARTVAGLSHPHIVTLHEIGDLDGQLFLAMELIEGGSLQGRLEKTGPLGIRETLDLLAGIADALDYAHGRELIHRDIKPGNILLRPTHRNQVEAVLTDFGLVKALAQSTQLTRTGVLVGTLEYMAPEQIDADLAGQVGPATDIYALGIVAYHMLTGQVPFSGSTAQVINGHLNKTPPSPAEVRSELPLSVSDAILRAIAKAPGERFPSATAFTQALAGASAPATTPAPASTPAPVPSPAPAASAPAPSTPAVAPGQKRTPARLLIAAGAILGLILLIVGISAVRSAGLAAQATATAEAIANMMLTPPPPPPDAGKGDIVRQDPGQVPPDPAQIDPDQTPVGIATLPPELALPTRAAQGTVLLRSSLSSVEAITHPEVGLGGATSLTAADFVPVHQSAGAYFKDRSRWASFPAARGGQANISLDAGEIEFWHRPDYDADADDLPHYLAVVGDIYHAPTMYLVEGDALAFGFVDASGRSYKTAAPWRAALWRAGEWVRIRVLWDASRVEDALAIYVNNDRVDQGGAAGGWDLGPVEEIGDIYVGAANSNGDFSATGVMESLTIRDGSAETVRGTPTPAAAGLRGQLVFTRNTEDGAAEANEIYLYDLESGETRRLTNNRFDDHIPRWSPDGSLIAFSSNRSGTYDIWVMDADGASPRAYISTSGWDEYAAWAPAGGVRVIGAANGRKLATGLEQAAVRLTLAFVTTADTQGVANAELFVGNESEVIRLTTNSGRDEWPSWSPDGSAIVFGSERNGDMDIYRLEVGLPPNPPQALYISTADENQPAWSPDGRWIVFVRRAEGNDGFGELMLGTGEGRAPVALAAAEAADPAWSPDSEWIVFSRGVDSDGDGRLTDQDHSHLWAVRVQDGLLIPLLELAGANSSPSWRFIDAAATPAPAPTPLGNAARITHISISNNRYSVAFETSGFQPRLGSGNLHLHFFFDTVPPDQAGRPGQGPWQIYPTQQGAVGASPFTLYGVSDRPANARQMCVLVANPDHSVQPGTGNCVELP